MASFEEEYFQKRRNWYGRMVEYSEVEHLVKRKVSFALGLLEKLYPSFVSGQGKDALVLGCGYGYEAEIIEKLGFSVVGIDISEYAVAVCKKRLPNCRFFVHDICDSIPVSLVDFVVGTEVLEHLTNPAKAIKNIHETLNQGGVALLTTPNKYSPYSLVNLVIDKTHINIKSPKEWLNLMNRLSWSSIKVHSVQWIPWIWRLVRFPSVGNSLIIIGVK